MVLIMVGGSLPVPLDPASVTLGDAVATLVMSHHTGLKSVDALLASSDWATLLYFAAMFVFVGGLERSGLLSDDCIPLPTALPLFEALMLGVVIGGSAAVIDSSSNLVAAGVARQHEARLGFRT